MKIPKISVFLIKKILFKCPKYTIFRVLINYIVNRVELEVVALKK